MANCEAAAKSGERNTKEKEKCERKMRGGKDKRKKSGTEKRERKGEEEVKIRNRRRVLVLLLSKLESSLPLSCFMITGTANTIT